MAEPQIVNESLRKLWNAWSPHRPTADWEDMSDLDRLNALRATVEHLDACVACQARIPPQNQALIRARYQYLTGSGR